MSLPFLRKRQMAGLIVERMKSSKEKSSEEGVGADQGDSLKETAKELIDAIHMNEVDKVAQLLRDAFVILESEPHVEGPHIEE